MHKGSLHVEENDDPMRVFSRLALQHGQQILHNRSGAITGSNLPSLHNLVIETGQGSISVSQSFK